VRPLAGHLLQQDDRAKSPRPARYHRSRYLGPVRFQSGNRGVNLRPLRGNPQSAIAPRAVRLSADGVRRRGGVRITGTYLSRESYGGDLRGCRFPSATRRLRAPGAGCWLSSGAVASPVFATRRWCLGSAHPPASCTADDESAVPAHNRASRHRELRDRSRSSGARGGCSSVALLLLVERL
jgi:hypothetical protein